MFFSSIPTKQLPCRLQVSHHAYLPADQVTLQRAIGLRMSVNGTGMYMLAHPIDGSIHGIGIPEETVTESTGQLTQNIGFRLDVLPKIPGEGFPNI